MFTVLTVLLNYIFIVDGDWILLIFVSFVGPDTESLV